MKKPFHQVSDHALVRYLERVKRVDVEALRRELARRVDLAAEGHDGCNAVIIGGYRFAIEGRVVTTIWHPNGRRRRKP